MSENTSRRMRVNSGQVPYLGVLLVMAAALWSAPAGAQVQDGRRIYDEQLRVQLDRQTPEAREIGFDAGGWFSFGFFNYDDELGEKHTLRQYELRAWGSLNVKGVHKFYVRGLVGYDDWNAGDNPKSYVGDEDTDPEIERAWYELDLGRLLSGQVATRPPVGFKVKVGRQFAEIGTALVLSTPLDMIKFDLDVPNWRLMALLGDAIDDTPNIDGSERVATHQDRCFWGLELTYEGLDHHRPFAYFLSNSDSTGATARRLTDPRQSFEYSSRYVGLGSRGTLVSPNLRYQAELVGEWGKTYSEGVTAGRDDICALAADVLLEYLFPGKTHPKVMLEYLYATGDDDRRASSSSTTGGNRPGTNDRAFNAFGFRDTGIAFTPKISNLHIYIVGASFFPFEDHKLFKKLEVGSKAFFYHKDKSGGPISDTTANTTEQWVGWEWDAYCNWRITSDLTWTLRYGAFRPGTAFRDQQCRQFLFTAVTFSF